MDRATAGRIGYQKSRLKLVAFIAAQRAASHQKHAGKTCRHCQRPLSYDKRRNRFCSRACAASFNNRGVSRRAHTASSTCPCGSIVRRSATCSRKCALDRRYDEYIAAWLQGLEPGGSWRGVSNYVRRWLSEVAGEKCLLCGWAELNPVTGKVPLQVDHRDGDPENHSPQNLRLLCPNCHSLTSTFGALNKGRGRAARYKRLPS